MIYQTDNQSISPVYRQFVEELAAFARRPDVHDLLVEVQHQAIAKLEGERVLPASVESLDLGQVNDLPTSLGSIRVAVIRGGFDGGVERHPNSTQVLLSLEGTGETHVKTDTGWRVDRYGQGVQLEDRWHVVPEGVWHKSAAPDLANWTVVAFHTAPVVQDEYMI